MPYQRMAAAILADWRVVQWELLLASAGSPEVAALKAKAEWLRDQYLELTEGARAHGRPEPPPFPTSAESDST